MADFQRMVAVELPRRHEPYQQAIAAARRTAAGAPSYLARLTGSGVGADTDRQFAPPPLELSFRQTNAYFESFGDHSDSANGVQIATARFQRAILALRHTEAELAAMRNDRLLLSFASSLALAAKSWLAVNSGEPRNGSGSTAASPAASSGQSQFEAWVLQTLWRQAQATLSEPGDVARTARSSSPPAP